MRTGCLLGLVLLIPAVGIAQEDTYELDDLIRAGERWVQENVDEDSLRSLDEVDREKVEQFLQEVRRRFQGEYVVDLAPFKQAVAVILPILASHESTRPYVPWLKARLDYFEVADEFRLTILPPKGEPGQPPPPVTNPGPEVERKAWRKEVEVRPVPREAESFLPRLKPIFAAQRVPAELVWMAEVESSFDPRACSPAGAAGLFQLMPATARQYGLSTWPRDERFNAEKSARAAARHLRHLEDRFRDWPLAVAAYNVGEGRIQELLDKHKATTFDDISGYLPAETQMYVPRVEATLTRREGVTLSNLEGAATKDDSEPRKPGP